MPKKISLTKQLEEAQKSEQYYRGQANVLGDSVRRLEKEAERKIEQERADSFRSLDSKRSEVDRLMEIIRWQINSETTRYPFAKAKSERSDRVDDNPHSIKSGGYMS